MSQPDRRSFLKIAGTSLGVGVLYSAYPAALSEVAPTAIRCRRAKKISARASATSVPIA